MIQQLQHLQQYFPPQKHGHPFEVEKKQHYERKYKIVCLKTQFFFIQCKSFILDVLYQIKCFIDKIKV